MVPLVLVRQPPEIFESPFGLADPPLAAMRRSEFSLTALAYNLRRAITILGLPALTAAVRT